MIKNNIKAYIDLRSTKSMEEIRRYLGLCEADVYILEIGYQLYLKNIPLDKALEKIETEFN